MPGSSEDLGDELAGIWSVVSMWHNGTSSDPRAADFTFAGGILHITSNTPNEFLS